MVKEKSKMGSIERYNIVNSRNKDENSSEDEKHRHLSTFYVYFKLRKQGRLDLLVYCSGISQIRMKIYAVYVRKVEPNVLGGEEKSAIS